MNKNNSNDTELQPNLKESIEDEELEQVTGGLRQPTKPTLKSTVLKGQTAQFTSTPYSGGDRRIKQCGSLDDLLSGEDSFGSGQGPVKC